MSREQQSLMGGRGFSENPAATLEQVFSAIHQERMAGLPVANPAIEVEAVEFQAWEGHWLGILITPWFLNLLVLPKQGSPWPESLETGKGKEITLVFPQGEYRFSAREEPGIGGYLSCSLASPVHDWSSQAEIRKTAREVMRLLKSIPLQSIDTTTTEADNAGQNTAESGGCALSRRAFLGAAG